jgi:hypothetical protein
MPTRPQGYLLSVVVNARLTETVKRVSDSRALTKLLGHFGISLRAIRFEHLNGGVKTICFTLRCI